MTSTTYHPISSINGVLVSSQAVTLTATTTIAGTAGTWADLTDGTTTMSVTLTPTNSNNKLLILGFISYNINGTTSSAFAKLKQDASDLIIGNAVGSNRKRAFLKLDLRTNTNYLHNSNFACMVTAGTTSSTTIKMQIMPQVTGNIFINRSETDTNSTAFHRGVSHMMVLEFSN